MEEDIKILENLKEYLQMLIDNGIHKIQYNELWHDEKTVDCINALENLIKGYRKLERKFKIKAGDVEYLENKINKHFIDDVTLQRDYIPKSKIDDKIEKYEEMWKATYTDLTHYGDLRRDTVLEVLEVLQELKEDK